MRIPFTTEQFFDVFRQYNEAVWPAQWVLMIGAAVAALAALRSPSPSAGRLTSGILTLLWLWMGAVYHLGFFRRINPAAVFFAILFVSQAGLFLWLGVRQDRVRFRAHRDGAGVAGALLLFYALIVYPGLGYALGHRYPTAPTFGLPCPTTIFTFGLLLWAATSVPRSLLIIPTVWAVVATTAALQLGVLEDFGLPVAAGVTLPLLLRGAHRRRAARRRPAPMRPQGELSERVASITSE